MQPHDLGNGVGVGGWGARKTHANIVSSCSPFWTEEICRMFVPGQGQAGNRTVTTTILWRYVPAPL